ncbi:hypothetical protein NRA01_16955 [Acinetobacter baumannii]|uniref:hypothetical protein n=1 Tax=Acinetobacter baumannii TaxID=470 RepID=UPI0010582723|nr:hypothetical protein [Acinetobacter baumannii]MDC4422665.1 hypothetical protein [Acinetobacter baumannii]MDC4567392.1 hypothetical protein [Acinetobacter baumannii]MDC4854118.1 hypothetical protein [Acinetobacter baumannii]MDC4959285.1 hypothetical protein [Acinetobacter baumannii]MDC4983857.1 hypothetical protein [Acinetobacter baumannii]
MLRLKCLGGPLYGQEYSHARDEFIFKDKQTLDFILPLDFFVAESISSAVAYHLALQLFK